MKKYIGIVYLALCIVVISFIGYSCANIIPPSGGPRDSLPPVLIDATPNDSTVNFNTNRITLNFDEYIDLKNNIAETLVT